MLELFAGIKDALPKLVAELPPENNRPIEPSAHDYIDRLKAHIRNRTVRILKDLADGREASTRLEFFVRVTNPNLTATQIEPLVGKLNEADPVFAPGASRGHFHVTRFTSSTIRSDCHDSQFYASVVFSLFGFPEVEALNRSTKRSDADSYADLSILVQEPAKPNHAITLPGEWILTGAGHENGHNVLRFQFQKA